MNNRAAQEINRRKLLPKQIELSTHQGDDDTFFCVVVGETAEGGTVEYSGIIPTPNDDHNLLVGVPPEGVWVWLGTEGCNMVPNNSPMKRGA